MKLNINRLVKFGFIPPLGSIATLQQSWSDSYTGEQLATATLKAERQTDCWGLCTIEIGDRQQRVLLEASPRYYGGVQWYFICPVMNRRASVLWMPPGTSTFASRQRWGRQVAYSSQFCDRTDRAHRGKARINALLCRIGGFNPDEWDLPPKPKGMRWRTYEKYQEQFDGYERQLEEGTAALLLRLEGLK